MAPALVAEMPSMAMRASSISLSSTPQANAPCAPPPCSAKLTTLVSPALDVGRTAMGSAVRWAARAAHRHGVPCVSPVYPAVLGPSNAWPKVGRSDRAQSSQATGLPRACSPAAPANAASAGMMLRHAALRHTNGRMSPGLSRRIIGISRGKMRLAFRGFGGRISGSENYTWGGSIMDYAHSEAYVQTPRWLICLNADEPPSPCLWGTRTSSGAPS